MSRRFGRTQAMKRHLDDLKAKGHVVHELRHSVDVSKCQCEVCTIPDELNLPKVSQSLWIAQWGHIDTKGYK